MQRLWLCLCWRIKTKLFNDLITNIDDLPLKLRLSVSKEESSYIESIKQKGLLPFGVTHYFANLADSNPNDPIRRQFFPDSREEIIDSFTLTDPLGEKLYSPHTRLVHQYKDRALILTCGSCFGYCRYCFRKSWIAHSQKFITDSELLPIIDYLKVHSEIKEVLISGGDPFIASDEELADLFKKLRDGRGDILLRLCTRAPITQPDRFTPDLIKILQKNRPLRFVVHINHIKELTGTVCNILEALVCAGIPVHTQTVLLKGINDNVEVLENLFRFCLNLGISPYYLFQLDLAVGVSHFRVPLKEGLSIYKELKNRISGLGFPKYAVDLPGGGGKILINDDVIAGTNGKVYLLKDHNGKLWQYPL